MKKYSCFLLFCCWIFHAKAQSVNPSGHRSKGKDQLVSFTASVPVGVYAESHIAGAGLAYAWSRHRFGDSVHAKKIIGFTAQAGLDYYFGKKVTTAGYSFRYGNHLYAHVMPGIIYNPSSRTNLSLLAGPVLGIYKESSSLALGVSLTGAYYFNSRISLGPVVFYRKHAEVDALWTAGLRVSYNL